MAYTMHKLHVRDGKASCYLVDPSDKFNNAPHYNPLTPANLPRLLFHSDLPYYQSIADQSVTLSLPSRAVNASYDGLTTVFGFPNCPYIDHYPFGTGTTPDAVPRAYLAVDNVYLDTWIQVQTLNIQAGITSIRWLSLVTSIAPSPVMRIRESWIAYNNSAAFPAISFSVRGIAFKRVVPTSGAPLMRWNGSTGVWQFGRLLLDGNGTGRLMRESSTGIPVTPDRTIDFSSTGVRIWNINTGTYTDIGTYSGSYSGPNVRRIA